jgi:hypothetical protein
MIEELKYSNGVGRTRAGEDKEGQTKGHFSLILLQNRDGQVSSHSKVKE